MQTAIISNRSDSLESPDTSEMKQADSLTEYPIVLVGTGPVGVRFAEELFKRGYRGSLIMFSEEPWDPYNRIKLTSLLAGEITFGDIDNTIAVSANHDIVQHLSCRIIAIDFVKKTVTDSNNREHRYEKLVLATGSRAHIPDIPGTDKEGVYTFRDIMDTEALLERTEQARDIAVIGGGLLGLESARALQLNGAKVTLVHQGPHILNHQLDGQGAPLLQSKIEQLGIRLLNGSGLAAILGDQSVRGIRLRNHQELPCDTVILATGIRANIELARRSWINVGHGVKVDNQLRTSAKDVFAIGECAEHNGQTYGLLLPGYEQAVVLAEHLLNGNSKYLGSVNLAQLNVVDEAVFSIGKVVEFGRSPLIREVSWKSRDKARYRKLVIYRGRLCGAMAVGDCPESRRIQQAVQQQRRVWFWQRWRFHWNGQLW